VKADRACLFKLSDLTVLLLIIKGDMVPVPAWAAASGGSASPMICSQLLNEVRQARAAHVCSSLI